MAPAGHLALGSFRQHRLNELRAWSTPVGLITIAIGGVACLKPLMGRQQHQQQQQQHGATTSEVVLESLTMAIYPLLVTLPMLLVRAGALRFLEPCVLASHCVRSLVLLSMGLGLTPFSQAMRTLLGLRIEMLLELLLGLQDQVSPSAMAPLHALRQVAWMSVWVNHMAGRPRDAAVRGALNWLVMMALTCGFELRNHASYAKQRQLLQRAAAEEEERAAPAAQALPRARLAGAHAPPAEPGGSRGPRKLAAKEAWEQEEEQWESHEGHFFSDLPMPEKPLGGARGACGSAAATGVAVGASGGLPGGGEESQPVGAAGEKGGQEDPVAQQRWDQPSPQQQQQQQPRAQAPRSEQLASDQGQQATAAAGRPSGSSMERRSPPAAEEEERWSSADEALPRGWRAAHHDDTDFWGLALSEGLHLPTVPLPSQQVLQRLPAVGGAAVAYRRRRRGAAATCAAEVATVKVHGVHVGDLPADLPAQLQMHLSATLPSLALVGVSVREGCVLLTLDLRGLADAAWHGGGGGGGGGVGPGACAGQAPPLAGGGGPAAAAAARAVAEAVAAVARGCGALGGALSHGQAMSVQAQGAVAVCRWDAESRQFQTLQLLDGSRGDGATPVPSSSPPPAQIAPSPLEQAIVHRMDTLRRQAGRCALRHVPAPAATWAAEGGGGARATFAVTVQLPPGCRVVGWEAATAAAAAPGGNVGVVAAGASRAPAEAVRGGAGAAGGDGGEVEAAVLVRRQAGPYLPVRVVSLSLPLPLPRGSCPGAEDADSSSAVLVTAKAEVQLGDVVQEAGLPLPLRLELWCRSLPSPTPANATTAAPTSPASPVPSTSTPPPPAAAQRPAAVGTDRDVASFGDPAPLFELLAAGCPLLALPPAERAAAAELARHLVEQGGVQPRRHLRPTLGAVAAAAACGSGGGLGEATAAAAATGQCGDGGGGSDGAEEGAASDGGEEEGDEEEGAATCLLEDLNALLSLPLSGGPAAPAAADGAAAAEAAAARRAGRDVLLHAVAHALPALAGLVAGALRRAEAAAGGAGPSSLLTPGGRRAAGGALREGAAVEAARLAQEAEEEGEEEGGGPHASLLHAAMASGEPGMLRLVLRWAEAQGGGAPLPWALADAQGLTPLHLAAAHPPAACAALLRALPLAAAREARRAWLAAPGGVGAPPAHAHALRWGHAAPPAPPQQAAVRGDAVGGGNALLRPQGSEGAAAGRCEGAGGATLRRQDGKPGVPTAAATDDASASSSSCSSSSAGGVWAGAGGAATIGAFDAMLPPLHSRAVPKKQQQQRQRPTLTVTVSSAGFDDGGGASNPCAAGVCCKAPLPVAAVGSAAATVAPAAAVAADPASRGAQAAPAVRRRWAVLLLLPVAAAFGVACASARWRGAEGAALFGGVLPPAAPPPLYRWQALLSLAALALAPILRRLLAQRPRDGASPPRPTSPRPWDGLGGAGDL